MIFKFDTDYFYYLAIFPIFVTCPKGTNGSINPCL